MEAAGFIRTECLKVIIKNNLSVREFKANAKRTRLRTTKNLEKVNKHICLWKKYGWL